MQSDLVAVILMKIFYLAQMAAMTKVLGMEVTDVNAVQEITLDLNYLVREGFQESSTIHATVKISSNENRLD